MKRKYLIITAMCILLGGSMQAQVTIGSGQVPIAGSLLDLKQKADGTSDKGLGMPRVNLTNLTPTTDAQLAASIGAIGTWDRNEHVGLVVYNVKNREVDRGETCPGVHVWNGSAWVSLVAYMPVDTVRIIVNKNVTAEVSRTLIDDAAKFPIAALGQFVDVRGPGKIESNTYNYARFYAYKVQATGDITYDGVKTPYTCDASKSVRTQWTETGAFEYIDEGIWMTENMNTEYQTDSSTIKMTKSFSDDYAVPLYFSPQNTGASAEQIRQNGFLYNWPAATHKKGGVTGEENVDNPGVFDEDHKVHKERQGICPKGWHVPSDKEYNELEEIYASKGSQFTNSAATTFPWLLTYNTVTDSRPNNFNVFGHGKSMKSTTSFNGLIANGDSKTVASGGFNALLTGFSFADSVSGYGHNGSFWSISSGSTAYDAWLRSVRRDTAGVYRRAEPRYMKYAVRCKKNDTRPN